MAFVTREAIEKRSGILPPEGATGRWVITNHMWYETPWGISAQLERVFTNPDTGGLTAIIAIQEHKKGEHTEYA